MCFLYSRSNTLLQLPLPVTLVHPYSTQKYLTHIHTAFACLRPSFPSGTLGGLLGIFDSGFALCWRI